MGEGGTAVILQRAEPGIRVAPIASGRQITAAIIAVGIVAEAKGFGGMVEGSVIKNVLA